MSVITHQQVKELFDALKKGDNTQFFKNVADDVNWQVMGTHPLAGRYVTKESFLKATFQRLAKVLQEGVILKVNDVFVDGDTAIVEMESLSTAKNAKPFNNTYCWIVRFKDGRIIAVRAYVDSALVKQLLDENEGVA